MRFDPTRPFVLLDDARAGTARLFTGLEAEVGANAGTEVAAALAGLRALGGDRAGFIGFEAGYALEPRLAALTRVPPDGLPLLWFGRFGSVQALRGAAIGELLEAGPAEVGPAQPALSRAGYDAMLARIAGLIAAGDVYQVNATFAATVAARGHPLALYRRLRAASLAPCSALIHTGARWILSLSPELFFRLEGRTVTTRPMKGTAPRGGTAAADDAAAAALAADPKNRAENLMIVDLLRNDLSRIAVPGSVAVPALFEVERYPTVLQMTSTVTAEARDGADAVEVLTALFPCGSITGAPKVRAMEVIASIEAAPRGLYTGSIGSIAANGDAAFNVAIRTLVVQPGGGAVLGLGGGIVADSRADDEWTEALAKGAFLERRTAPADLIETMRFETGAVLYRERHLARLGASAAFLGHRFERPAIEAALDAATAGMDGPARLRLLVARSGALALQAGPLPAATARPVETVLAALPVAPSDWRLAHKTGDRGFYDDARRVSGAFEVLFVRADRRITEGSFTNLFVPQGGRLATPPLALGLLPGVLRAELIARGDAFEADLTAADLTGGFFIGNALRGLIEARLRIIA